jgi:hypothetical protein
VPKSPPQGASAAIAAPQPSQIIMNQEMLKTHRAMGGRMMEVLALAKNRCKFPAWQ